MAGISLQDNCKAKKSLLHVDGSSTIQGSSAGIVITYPQGEDLEFAAKFSFKAPNNKAEYEALVIGMKMAHEEGTRHLPRVPIAIQAISSTEDWKTPVIRWLEEERLPDNKWEATKLKLELSVSYCRAGLL
ncbi:UNVERIFIED_CONTAM: hypothetical protein Sangu_0675200 [Sesamum angustifolium]|uniref:RNase H type-1 domain-containing protein n=1 Tax=Sesamum angustifolium TaxID=2727405 RepID=A0AAW2PQQ9_9LAMI